MSATTRQSIADAINAAAIPMGTGTVSATPVRPALLAQGAAWPKTAAWDRDGVGFARTWQVWLVLPQDEQAADDWMDNYLGDVEEALMPVVYVDRIEPIVIPTGEAGSTALFGALITGRSE